MRCVRLAVFLAACLSSPVAWAQQLTEAFDSVPSLTSADWAMVNLSSPVGSQPNWFQGNPSVFSAHAGATNAYAVANYQMVAGSNTISAWLITPVVKLNRNTVVTFYARKVSPDSYPDRLEVRVSTNGASTDVGNTNASVGDFTVLALSINPTLVTGVFPTGWTQFSLDLSELPITVVEGRIGFRYYVTNGGPSGSNSDYMGIDTLEVGDACGDNAIQGTEACDDGNNTNGDGCSETCAFESGFVCMGTSSSVCTATCGDGLIVGGEACDDGDTDDGDGCSATCTQETGYACSGAPSICQPVCGDGLILGAETCDDGDTDGGDGCSATCAQETGYACSGAPSVCQAVCGDGLIVGAETCDDGDTDGGDGCSATCAQETGYVCADAPSVCQAVCGDGLILGAEACDDGNATAGDGCSATCTQETGYACAGAPSVCQPVCGDGIVAGGEACDDGNTIDNDGCLSSCVLAQCGDGVAQVGVEACDDGNRVDGDGCSASCTLEDQPSGEESPREKAPGCGCGGSGVGAAAWLLAALLGLSRRRRPRR